MKQMTLAVAGFERYGKTTRRATFLAEMDKVVPWAELCKLVEPYYPKAGNGRPPIGLERMLRIYFLQQWFNLADPAVEEALYDSLAMRGFVGIDLVQLDLMKKVVKQNGGKFVILFLWQPRVVEHHARAKHHQFSSLLLSIVVYGFCALPHGTDGAVQRVRHEAAAD